MPEANDINLRCFLALPFSAEFDAVRHCVKEATLDAGFEPVSLDDHPAAAKSIERALFAELARADCIVADVSAGNANVFFEIGQAFAMAKGIVLLADESARGGLPFDVQNLNVVRYHPSKKGMLDLERRLSKELQRLRRGARRGSPIFRGRGSMPFFVDWDRLDYEDVENLCRELLLQMGYRRVEWHKGSREFDVVAELPKKDPDGFEYTELWLVSLGRNAPIEMLLDMAAQDPEFLMHRLLREELIDERRLYGRGDDVFLTLLFVVLHGKASAEEARMLSERISRRSRKRRFPFQVRVRVWDRDYVTNLIHQFPQLGYKYFSDEARSLAKFRKGPEELYRENVQLTERLAKLLSDLKEEKNLRVRAERDAVWKDISFSAAHKIGNPIFAIETDLGPLRKRIREVRTDEAIEVTDNMQSSVEKAKGIVEQFKSLTKAQQVNPIPMLLRPALDEVRKSLVTQGAKCVIDCDSSVNVLADPERLAEVLDELGANAMHWVGKRKPEIRLEVELPASETLPSNVDSSRAYVLLHFKDNGTGIADDDKERIFEAFFTTYDQGTGLGLALVRRIIEGHGGMIREIGLAGRGADFEVFLPRAKQPNTEQSEK